MKQRKATQGTNAAGRRVNGHAAGVDSSRAPLQAAAAAETPRDVANGRGRVSTPRDVAASVDARDTSVAGAARTGAACSDREAYAEAALPRPTESKRGRVQPDFSGPTEPSALENGSSFVCAVAARVDLVGVSASLVCSTDEKIKKAELDRLRQLIFDDAGAAPEEPPRLDFGDLLKPTAQQ